MARRRKRSRQWLQAHRSDPYVQSARREGYRSRAVYKLQEIDARDRLLRPGRAVVDLGAAPGAWSQYARHRVGPKPAVVAVDVLAMEPIEGVVFLQADLREADALAAIERRVPEGVDLVLSDMAPNISGINAVDQPRAMALAEDAAAAAEQLLRPGGDLLLKVFQGEGFEELRSHLRERFRTVSVRRPAASRGASRELYLLARNYDL